MLDVLREPTISDSPEISRRDFGFDLLRKLVAVKCCTLLTEQTAQADDNAQTEQTEEPESLPTQIRYLLQWIRSDEGTRMAEKLREAERTLEDSSYGVRQKATDTIMTSMNTLQSMIFPFPEELREILGLGSSRVICTEKIVEICVKNMAIRQDSLLILGTYRKPDE